MSTLIFVHLAWPLVVYENAHKGALVSSNGPVWSRPDWVKGELSMKVVPMRFRILYDARQDGNQE